MFPIILSVVALSLGLTRAFPYHFGAPIGGYNSTSVGNTTVFPEYVPHTLNVTNMTALDCVGQPYYPELYTCWDGYRLCPRGTRACGTDPDFYDCYFSHQYSCVNETLVQVPSGHFPPYGNMTAPYGNSTAIGTAVYPSGTAPAATGTASFPMGNSTVAFPSSFPTSYDEWVKYAGVDEYDEYDGYDQDDDYDEYPAYPAYPAYPVYVGDNERLSFSSSQ